LKVAFFLLYSTGGLGTYFCYIFIGCYGGFGTLFIIGFFVWIGWFGIWTFWFWFIVAALLPVVTVYWLNWPKKSKFIYFLFVDGDFIIFWGDSFDGTFGGATVGPNNALIAYFFCYGGFRTSFYFFGTLSPNILNIAAFFLGSWETGSTFFYWTPGSTFFCGAWFIFWFVVGCDVVEPPLASLGSGFFLNA